MAQVKDVSAVAGCADAVVFASVCAHVLGRAPSHEIHSRLAVEGFAETTRSVAYHQNDRPGHSFARGHPIARRLALLDCIARAGNAAVHEVARTACSFGGVLLASTPS